MKQASVLPSVALNKEFIVDESVDAEIGKDSAIATTKKMHGFRVGGFGLLVSSDVVVSEVFESLPTCPLPNTPDWFYGMANQRGNIIPIFNMPAILGMDPDTSHSPYFLVIGSKNDAFGMLTYELPERITITPECQLDNTPPMPEALVPHTHGYYQVDGSIWVDWDPFGFISAVSENM